VHYTFVREARRDDVSEPARVGSTAKNKLLESWVDEDLTKSARSVREKFEKKSLETSIVNH